MLNRSKRIVVLLITCLTVGMLMAQSTAIFPKGNSPYSRFGLGDLVSQNLAATGGMAGLSAAFNDPYHLNLQNPASLAYLQSTAFEIGFYGRYANLRDQNNSTNLWTGNLNYLALGFPLINPISRVLDQNKSPWDLGMALSLQPFSTVGYDIRAEVQQPGDVELTTNIFKGNGGTYRLNWGLGVKHKNLAAGINAGYFFGKITNNLRVEFDSLELAYGTEINNETSVNGFIWDAGVQYTLEFGKINKTQSARQRLTLGVYGSNATNFNTNFSQLFIRNNFYTPIDTLVNINNQTGKGTLPAHWTAGLTYEQPNKFKIGAEYSAASWSEYRNEGKEESIDFLDANRLGVGLEWIPDFNSYNAYLSRVRYRLGFIYATDPRTVSGEQLKQYSLTLGAGFPIILPRQQVSFINLSVEGGQFGLPDAVRETFIRMTLGFTLNDNTWFFKRKFG
ncbi:MAG: hypothetical protein ACK4TA_01740 [Saprospiraceae bacterium]